MKTNKKFEIGEIVYDGNNKRYGVVLNNYPNGDGYGEIRLDSDGNQPIENLHKLGAEQDKGTKKKLIECLKSYTRLMNNWPEQNYPRINF